MIFINIQPKDSAWFHLRIISYFGVYYDTIAFSPPVSQIEIMTEQRNDDNICISLNTHNTNVTGFLEWVYLTENRELVKRDLGEARWEAGRTWSHKGSDATSPLVMASDNRR